MTAGRADDEVEYLRAYDDDLGGALELVINDLVTAGLDRAHAEERVWHHAQLRLDHVGHEAGGQTALWIIDRLQDDLVESREDHIWPRCPEHGSHPIWITRDSGPGAMWTCQQSGRRVAKLGELRALERGSVNNR